VSDLESQVQKQKITAAVMNEIMNRIHFTGKISQCIADIIIEAVLERLDVKISLFNELSGLNKRTTILVTNTSSLSISQLAELTDIPERVAGLHFFNPAPLMKLVEIVKGKRTSEEIISRLVNFTHRLGKIPVVCIDSPGFIVNRIARPYYIESLRLAEEGMGDFHTIDRLLESKGFRMGPFRLMDLIGNDINYAVSCSVYEKLKQPDRLKPSIIQKEKVDKGELGRKTGKGYYGY
jgi:3-hydroxybutyryl-CoA dehydrogenase